MNPITNETVTTLIRACFIIFIGLYVIVQLKKITADKVMRRVAMIFGTIVLAVAVLYSPAIDKIFDLFMKAKSSDIHSAPEIYNRPLGNVLNPTMPAPKGEVTQQAQKPKEVEQDDCLQNVTCEQDCPQDYACETDDQETQSE
jgi:NAD-dependent dihydropyrimidine dehydrogenase PreA subunit